MVHTFVATMRSGWPRLIRLRRPPTGDHADAFSRLPVVGDTREHSAYLDHRRKLAVLVEGLADRGGLCLSD